MWGQLLDPCHLQQPLVSIIIMLVLDLYIDLLSISSIRSHELLHLLGVLTDVNSGLFKGKSLGVQEIDNIKSVAADYSFERVLYTVWLSTPCSYCHEITIHARQMHLHTKFRFCSTRVPYS